jgi:predicted dehydrogenase
MIDKVNAKEFRIAFIGSGNMAQAHALAFQNISGVKLVGVFSRSLEKAKLFAIKNKVEFVCSSVKGLYETASPDLVVIAVGELSVFDICTESFKFPWKLLIEKPVGYNLGQADTLATLSQELGAKAYVALNRRHYSSTRAVLNEVDGSNSTRLVQVYDQGDPAAGLLEGKPRMVVENWRYANSIHVVDYFSIFCRGNLSSIERLTNWSDRAAAYCLARLNFSSGDVGVYQAIWNAPGPWAVTVTTAEKRWEMRPLEAACRQSYNSRKIESIPLDDLDLQFKPGLRLQAEEALKAVQGAPHQLPTLEDGVKTMRLIRGIYGA